MKKSLTKNKKCKNKDCNKLFDQIRFGQVACSIQCAIEIDRQKRKAKEAKEWRQEKKQRKEKLKTLNDWCKDLETEINKIVRLIDKGNPCMMCSVHPMKKVNACHYHSVGSSPSLRFNLFNEWTGCESCNNHKGGNIHGYDILLIEKYGREKWEYIKFDLIRLYPYLGLTIPELKEKIKEARKIVKELKSIDLLTPYPYSLRWSMREKYNKRLKIYL